MSSFKVLIADPLSEDGIHPLLEEDNIEVVVDTGLSPEALLEKIPEFDALLVRSQTQVNHEVIERGTNLKVIGRAGVGVDNIDIKAATENGVIVVNAPNGNTNSAAEHTIAMIMGLARKIPQAHHALKAGRWDRKIYLGVEVKGKTLGIVGLGRIGEEVAYRAKGQRMKVIAYDPFLTQERADRLGIEHGTLDEVLQASDFITVHTPLLEETRHLINKDAFAKMKDGVKIVNCARGGIIDEEALYQAILDKKVAGAALDVYEQEPVTDHKLFELDEVIATPHLGASTVEAQENVAIDTSKDVLRILNGGSALNPVNIPSVPNEMLKKVEPYFHLAEKLGTFLAIVAKEPVEEFHVRFAGNLTDLNVAPITRNALKGFLKYHLGSRVNDVNAAYLATSKGITVSEHKSSEANGFTNLVTVEIKTEKASYSVVGTLLKGLGARIVRVDRYTTDVVPEGHIVMIHHKDQPGAIGRVGTLLAENDVNIATMQVGRSESGGEAIMMLTIDKPLEDQTITEVQNLSDIYRAVEIDL